jgi:hypothetical protein
MPSFRISVTPSRRAAARYVTKVRRALQKAYAEEKRDNGLTQTAIAKAIDVHRSVINRELRGQKDITIGRVGELAWAMGRIPSFDLLQISPRMGSNLPASSGTAVASMRPLAVSTGPSMAPANNNSPAVATLLAN